MKQVGMYVHSIINGGKEFKIDVIDGSKEYKVVVTKEELGLNLNTTLPVTEQFRQVSEAVKGKEEVILAKLTELIK